MKRVVTGHDEDGRSVFRSIGEFEATVETPVVDWFEAWSTYTDDASRSMRPRFSRSIPGAPSFHALVRAASGS